MEVNILAKSLIFNCIIILGILLVCHANYLLLSGSRAESSDQIASYIVNQSQWLYQTGILITLLASINFLKYRILPLLILISGILNYEGFFFFKLHPILEEYNIYPPLLRNAFGHISFQYGFLFPYLILISILLMIVILKWKKKNYARILALSFVIGSLMSTYAFHQSILTNSFQKTADKIILQASETLNKAELEVLVDECKFGKMKCQGVKSSQDITQIEHSSEFQEKFLERISYQSQNSSVWNNPNDTENYSQPAPILSPAIDGLALHLRNIDGNVHAYFLKIDFNSLGDVYRIYFGFLVTVFHLLWLFGLYILLRYHETRKVGRL